MNLIQIETRVCDDDDDDWLITFNKIEKFQTSSHRWCYCIHVINNKPANSNNNENKKQALVAKFLIYEKKENFHTNLDFD